MEKTNLKLRLNTLFNIFQRWTESFSALVHRVLNAVNKYTPRLVYSIYQVVQPRELFPRPFVHRCYWLELTCKLFKKWGLIFNMWNSLNASRDPNSNGDSQRSKEHTTSIRTVTHPSFPTIIHSSAFVYLYHSHLGQSRTPILPEKMHSKIFVRHIYYQSRLAPGSKFPSGQYTTPKKTPLDKLQIFTLIY